MDGMIYRWVVSGQDGRKPPTKEINWCKQQGVQQNDRSMVVSIINFFNTCFHFTSFKSPKTQCNSYTLQYLRTFGVAIAPIFVVDKIPHNRPPYISSSECNT